MQVPVTDIMKGGPGDDLYEVDNVGDMVIESPGQGMDMVVATVTYTLNTNFENLDMDGANPINGTGNSENNSINGNEAANILSGLLGMTAYSEMAGTILFWAVRAMTALRDGQ